MLTFAMTKENDILVASQQPASRAGVFLQTRSQADVNQLGAA
jgi:hypothetical protein